MNERQDSEIDVQADKIDNPRSKGGTENADANETRRRSSAKRRTSPAKSFWSRLNPPQAAVLVGIISALVSLTGAGISIWNTPHQKELEHYYQKELEKYKAVSSRNQERYDKSVLAYEEAIKAIKHMKNAIQDVLTDKNVTVDHARNLREASRKLNEAYENNGTAITASDSNLSGIFHDAKSLGRSACAVLQGENEQTSTKLSEDSKRILETTLDQLSSTEKKLQEKYSSLIEN